MLHRFPKCSTSEQGRKKSSRFSWWRNVFRSQLPKHLVALFDQVTEFFALVAQTAFVNLRIQFLDLSANDVFVLLFLALFVRQQLLPLSHPLLLFGLILGIIPTRQ